MSSSSSGPRVRSSASPTSRSSITKSVKCGLFVHELGRPGGRIAGQAPCLFELRHPNARRRPTTEYPVAPPRYSPDLPVAPNVNIGGPHKRKYSSKRSPSRGSRSPENPDGLVSTALISATSCESDNARNIKVDVDRANLVRNDQFRLQLVALPSVSRSPRCT